MRASARNPATAPGALAVIAYQPQEWHDLFVAVAGAAAALGGLIFVAVSLNLDQVLQLPSLPPLAARPWRC